MLKNEEVQQIFSSIFILETKSNTEFPILISSKDISKLIIYLKDTNKPLEQKMEILTTLLGYFQFNENLINVFMRSIFYNSKLYTLLDPIIDLYISPLLTEDQISLIEKIIKYFLFRKFTF